MTCLITSRLDLSYLHSFDYLSHDANRMTTIILQRALLSHMIMFHRTSYTTYGLVYMIVLLLLEVLCHGSTFVRSTVLWTYFSEKHCVVEVLLWEALCRGSTVVRSTVLWKFFCEKHCVVEVLLWEAMCRRSTFLGNTIVELFLWEALSWKCCHRSAGVESPPKAGFSAMNSNSKHRRLL